MEEADVEINDTGLYISPKQLAPTMRNDVPWNAVKMRKMKKAARLGLSAVPKEHPKKRTALVKLIYIAQGP